MRANGGIGAVVLGALMLALGGCAHPLATARAYHVAVSLPDGDVLVIGGDGGFPPLASVGRFDADRTRWRATAPLPSGLKRHTATELADGRVLVAGGYGAEADDRRAALIYDPSADRWQRVAPMAIARHFHNATRLADGRVLVVGGTDQTTAGELYDPRTDRWAPTAEAPGAVSAGTATTLHDGRVLLVGRLVDDEERPAGLLYDPRADRWSVTGPMSDGRAFHTATLLGDGRVWVIGGRWPAKSGPSTNALDSSEVYDPRRNHWTPGPRLSQARSDHTATIVGHVLVVAGGMPSGWGQQRPLRSAELFDLVRGERASTSIGRNRSDHTASALPNNRVLLVGGRTELIVSKWDLRWSRPVRLRGRWRKAARRPPARVLHLDLHVPTGHGQSRETDAPVDGPAAQSAPEDRLTLPRPHR